MNQQESHQKILLITGTTKFMSVSKAEIYWKVLKNTKGGKVNIILKMKTQCVVNTIFLTNKYYSCEVFN